MRAELLKGNEIVRFSWSDREGRVDITYVDAQTGYTYPRDGVKSSMDRKEAREYWKALIVEGFVRRTGLDHAKTNVREK